MYRLTNIVLNAFRYPRVTTRLIHTYQRYFKRVTIEKEYETKPLDLKKHNFGGKTNGLLNLRMAKFNVPQFEFVRTDSEGKYGTNHKAVLEAVAKFPPEVTTFAVRSSASDEDADGKSQAGAYHTELAVKREDVYKAYLKVEQSYNGKSGTVIVQQFVCSDKAFVGFTNAGQDVTVINGNFGLCDTVVKGDAVDQYMILNENNHIFRKIINKKRAQYYVIDDPQTGAGHFTTVEHQDASFTDDEIKLIVAEFKRIQKYFGRPMDVEGCMKNGKVFILQARPITKQNILSVRYFDGANIQESLPGIVEPLTFTCMQYAYSRIYPTAFNFGGVSEEATKSVQFAFDELLAIHNGRVYYNMDHWDMMLRLFPFRKDNFENMITNNVPGYKYRLEFYPAQISKSWFYFSVFLTYMSLQNRINALLHDATGSIIALRRRNIDQMTYRECFEQISEYNRTFMADWYLIGINDFLVSHFYRKLKQRFAPDKLKEVIRFESASTKQIKALKDLSTAMKQDMNVWTAINEGDEQKYYQGLEQNAELKGKLTVYKEKYGGRFCNEMKFETIDAIKDFGQFRELMKSYENYQMKEHKHNDLALPLRDKYYYIPGFKHHAQNRENLRLLRSNFFGALRELFTRIGVILAENGIINEPRDVFFMHFREIMSRSTLQEYNNCNFKNLIYPRKQEYMIYEKLDAPNYFISVNDDRPRQSDQALERKHFGILRGTGCAPGMVRGKVKLFKNVTIPREPFDILVAQNTDPGWVPLIGMSKAMIIAQGGDLSHAAIVAREDNIPTVIGIEGVMDILEDGQMVEVDGSRGIVTIV